MKEHPTSPATLPSQGAAELAAGHKVGDYIVEHKLGSGGFGTVYVGVHPLIEKRVAIKVLSAAASADPQIVSRFVEEARAASRIKSTHIVDAFTFGTLVDGRCYLVMELLEGLGFDRLIRDHGPLAPELAIAILRGVASALDAAHELGIVHRDIKPANVFITFDEAATPHPKLLDFGIAKLLDDGLRKGHQTITGTPMGTVQYMSPEQCRGEAVDHRADIYSFGVMAFEAFTSQRPFWAESQVELMYEHMTRDPPDASSIRGSLGSHFDGPLCRMLAKKPADRPATAGAAVAELAEAAAAAGLDVTSSPVVPSAMRRPRPRAEAEAASTVRPRAAPAAMGTLSRSPSTVETPRAPARRAPLLLLALALGAAAGVGYLLLQSQGQEEVDPSGTATAESSPTQLASATIAVALPARAGNDPSRADAIELHVQTTAPGARVSLDGKDLGPAPGPFRVERDPKAHELRVEAPGFRPSTQALALDRDRTVAIALELQPATRAPSKPKKRLPKELEAPEFAAPQRP